MRVHKSQFGGVLWPARDWPVVAHAGGDLIEAKQLDDAIGGTFVLVGAGFSVDGGMRSISSSVFFRKGRDVEILARTRRSPGRGKQSCAKEGVSWQKTKHQKQSQVTTRWASKR